MAAIVPPPNASGVPPPNLVLPITYNDIASARTYLKDLSWTQASPAHQSPATADDIGKAEVYRFSLASSMVQGPAAPPWVQQLNTKIDAIQTDVTAMRADITTIQADITTIQADITTIQADITAMRVDITAIQANITTLQVDVNMTQGNINTIQGNLAQLQLKSEEAPIILANSRAGNWERLYDPTQLQGGWAVALARPQHRDDLLTMSVQDCMATAMALALPPLPPTTTVRERRHQIARRIGVSLHY